jgi:hypothetical protein
MSIDKKQAEARLSAIETEAAELRKLIEEEDKPLTWPELPDGSTFGFGDRGHVTQGAMCLKMGGEFFHHDDGRFSHGPWSCRKYEAVTRVNLDGTPYEGDPRK